MELFTTILTIAVWPLCAVLIGLILLQGGTGDVSSAFGGGGQLDTTLGVGASRKMAKLTGWLGVTFFAIVIFLAIPSAKSYRSYQTTPQSTEKPESTDKPRTPLSATAERTVNGLNATSAQRAPSGTAARIPAATSAEPVAPTVVPVSRPQAEAPTIGSTLSNVVAETATMAAKMTESASEFSASAAALLGSTPAQPSVSASTGVAP